MKNKSLVTIILVSIVTFAALVFSLYKFVLKEKTVFKNIYPRRFAKINRRGFK